MASVRFACGPQQPEATSPLSPELKAPWAARRGALPSEVTPSTNSGTSGTPPSLNASKELGEEEATEMRKYVRMLVEELEHEDQPEEAEQAPEPAPTSPAGRPSQRRYSLQSLQSVQSVQSAQSGPVPCTPAAMLAALENPPSPTKQPRRPPLAVLRGSNAGACGFRDRLPSKDSSSMMMVHSKSKESLISGTSMTSTLSHTVCRLTFDSSADASNSPVRRRSREAAALAEASRAQEAQQQAGGLFSRYRRFVFL